MATVYPFQRPTDPIHGAPTYQGPSRFLDSPLPAPHDSTPNHTFNLRHGIRTERIESQLRQFEAASRKKYLQAIDNMPAVTPAGWFSRQLEHDIIPALIRIGFDEAFARILFQIAAPSWQRMGPLENNCIWFCPDLIRNLNAIREETVQNAASESDASWLVLPRVYRFLEEKQSAYMICYLNYLADEPASAFRRILTRVIIEFVGNYTLKYRSRNVCGCRLDAAIFYGYATMFWKNLRTPPPGFEDDLIFNHCLRWIKLFPGKCTELSEDMTRCVGEMEAWRQKIMLAADSFQPADKDCPGLGRLLVALRHGRPGTEAAIEFMGNWLLSSRPDAAGPSVSGLLPTALIKLFQTIKMRLPVESAEVQKSLGKFLRGLHENIASNGIDKPGDSGKQTEKFRFVIRRVLGDIDGMTASLF